MEIDRRSLVEEVASIARGAGSAILSHYEAHTRVRHKPDGSPVTEADREASDFIIQHLERITPDVPIVCEEGRASFSYEERKHWPRCWVVDPLDGTKEFLKKSGEFTVNIALVESGRPVLGVIYAPALNWVYRASDGIATVERSGEQTRQMVTRRADAADLAMVASRDHAGPVVTAVLARWPEIKTRSMGSSLKFCLVAEGLADLYLRDVPTMEWDTAAAQCILEAAGGRVMTLDAESLGYNKRSFQNPAIIAVGDPDLDWRRLLGTAAASPCKTE